ncbi:TPA: hypothetical protein N0F65_011176, partial [Lagenidium giganteum]
SVIKPRLQRIHSERRWARGARDALCWCYHRIARMRVSNIGAYSIEKFLSLASFDEHCISLKRSILFVIAVPLPAFAVVLLLDCIPLASPALGWRANTAFWARTEVGLWVITCANVSWFAGKISGFQLSVARGLTVATITTTITVGSSIAIAAAIDTFPLPFMYVLASLPHNTLVIVLLFVAVGKKNMQAIPGLKSQVNRVCTLAGTMVLPTAIYPAVNALYEHVSPSVQWLLMILSLGIKSMFKYVVASNALAFEDSIATITTMSVNLYHTLYTVRCVQTSNTWKTTTLVIALDAIQTVLSLRHIGSEIAAIDKLYAATSVRPTSSKNKRALLPTVVELIQRQRKLDPSVTKHLALYGYQPRAMNTHDAYWAAGFVVVCSLFEIASFACAHVILSRRLHLRPIQHLAFALWSDFAQVQGQLFIWLLYGFSQPLVHAGCDYSFESFRDVKKSPTTG